MIEIDAVVDKDGVLKSCKACGHAKTMSIFNKAGPAGNDVICAAVSVLMYSALSSLSNRKGITITGDWSQEGLIWLNTGYEADGKDFLFAAGVFLIEGLKFVAQEYPKNCKLVIRTED